MNQTLLQYPKTDQGDKENLMPSAVPCDMNNFSRTISTMSSSFVLDTGSPPEHHLLEQKCNPVDLTSVCPHQGNRDQTSYSPLAEMSLMTLARRCTEEINKYRRNEPCDERYGMEIVRRAIVLRDHDAWATLQRQFTENVHSWFARHTCREDALRYENEQDYIDDAFHRFWQATSNQALTFTSLAGTLRYLRLCVHCAIMDTLRTYAHTRLEALPQPGHPNEPRVEDHYNEGELWDTISSLLMNERERRVAYLHFHCNLKPREIMRYCPGEFSNEEEIYRIKRNILDRITRNIDRIRWRLGDNLS